MFFNGLKFGMLLQIAIGPVCMFILNTAINTNFLNSFIAVIAVALVDSVYIILAVIGVVSFIKDEKYQFTFKIFSFTVVFLFGINIIISSFGINIIPNLNFNIGSRINNSFIYAFILTASNPLTILFWAGVFSSKVTEYGLKRIELFYFGFGCICSTFIFLSFVGLLGLFFHYYLPKEIIAGLNFIVGIILIYFSFRILRKKRVKETL